MRVELTAGMLATAMGGGALVSCSALLDITELPAGNVDGSEPDAPAAADATDGADAAPASSRGDTGSAQPGSDATSNVVVGDGGSRASGCDAQTTNDPSNCGACGHDCLGGQCVESRCQPVAVANNATGTIGGVAVDGTDVYWTVTGGPVMHCTIACDGGSGEGFANVGTATGAIAVDSANVYWATSSGVQRCSRVGGCTPQTLADDGGQPAQFAIQGTNLFWTEPQTGNVMKSSTAGSGGPAVALATGEPSPVGIATDGNLVYWTDETSVGAGAKECSVDGCPSTGPTPIAPSLAAGGVGIAVSEGTVYWSTQLSAPSIVSCPITGCPGSPASYASTSKTAGFVLADSNTVFWAWTLSTPIDACSLPTCAKPDTLVTTTRVSSMTLATQAVYWTDTQTVWRVAK